MTGHRAGRRVALIIEYEPSWFAEFMSGLGVFLWAGAALLTDDYMLRGWAWLLPAVGCLFGPLRIGLLFRLYPAARVLAAGLGALWWGWLLYTLFRRWGIVPACGAFAALWVGDLLTVAKFSLAALRLRRFPRTA